MKNISTLLVVLFVAQITAAQDYKFGKVSKEELQEKFNPDGFNIGVNINSDAGQTIWHSHIHIIPRYKGDIENPRGGIRAVIPNKKEY